MNFSNAPIMVFRISVKNNPSIGIIMGGVLGGIGLLLIVLIISECLRKEFCWKGLFRNIPGQLIQISVSGITKWTFSSLL